MYLDRQQQKTAHREALTHMKQVRQDLSTDLDQKLKSVNSHFQELCDTHSDSLGSLHSTVQQTRERAIDLANQLSALKQAVGKKASLEDLRELRTSLEKKKTGKIADKLRQQISEKLQVASSSVKE